MSALVSLLNRIQALFVIGATADVVLFVISHQSASATVANPNRDIEFFSLYFDTRDAWSDGSTMWVT